MKLYKFAKNFRPGDYYIYGGQAELVADVAEIDYPTEDENGNTYNRKWVVFLHEGDKIPKYFEPEYAVEIPAAPGT